MQDLPGEVNTGQTGKNTRMWRPHTYSHVVYYLSYIMYTIALFLNQVQHLCPLDEIMCVCTLCKSEINDTATLYAVTLL